MLVDYRVIEAAGATSGYCVSGRGIIGEKLLEAFGILIQGLAILAVGHYSGALSAWDEIHYLFIPRKFKVLLITAMPYRVAISVSAVEAHVGTRKVFAAVPGRAVERFRVLKPRRLSWLAIHLFNFLPRRKNWSRICPHADATEKLLLSFELFVLLLS